MHACSVGAGSRTGGGGSGGTGGSGFLCTLVSPPALPSAAADHGPVPHPLLSRSQAQVAVKAVRPKIPGGEDTAQVAVQAAQVRMRGQRRQRWCPFIMQWPTSLLLTAPCHAARRLQQKAGENAQPLAARLRSCSLTAAAFLLLPLFLCRRLTRSWGRCAGQQRKCMIGCTMAMCCRPLGHSRSRTPGEHRNKSCSVVWPPLLQPCCCSPCAAARSQRALFVSAARSRAACSSCHSCCLC